MEKQKVITLSQSSESSNALVKNQNLGKKLKEFKITHLQEMQIDGTECFEDYYDSLSILGMGAFGIVISAVDKREGEIYAIKIIKKKSLSDKRMKYIRKEAELMAILHHKNVVMFKKVLESEDYFLIVMELVKGGSLKKFLIKRRKSKKPLCEDEVRIIMKNVLEGLSYIHSKDIIHRDIKLENVLIHHFKDLSSIKIADFGLGARFDTSVADNCGTLLYMAPEVASNKKYTKQADMWSCGIIMYILLTGHHPFYKKGDSNPTFLEKLKAPKWKFPSIFSESAKSLFLKLCSVPFLDRYTANQALAHPWILNDASVQPPLTIEEEITLQQSEDKMLLLARVFYFLSIKTKNMRTKLKKYHLVTDIEFEEKQYKTMNKKGSVGEIDKTESPFVSNGKRIVLHSPFKPVIAKPHYTNYITPKKAPSKVSDVMKGRYSSPLKPQLDQKTKYIGGRLSCSPPTRTRPRKMTNCFNGINNKPDTPGGLGGILKMKRCFP